MFLHDTSINMLSTGKFDAKLNPRILFCGESILTEYHVVNVSNADIVKIHVFVEEYRKVLAYHYGEVNVYLVTNNGYFGPLCRRWETVIQQINFGKIS